MKPSVPQKLVHVKYDPAKTNVKALVKTINTKTSYRAREPKPTEKASAAGGGKRLAAGGSATTFDATAAKETAAKDAALKTVTLKIAGMH